MANYAHGVVWGYLRTDVDANQPEHVARPVRVLHTMPLDVLTMVLELLPPHSLVLARQVSIEWACLIGDYNHIWANARLRHYPDMPAPYEGMTDRWYIFLMCGSGCMGCGGRATRRIVWGFQRRLCEACFGRETIRGDAIGHVEVLGHNLLNCIPRAMSFSSGRPPATRVIRWNPLFSAGHDNYWLKSDVQTIVAELQRMTAADIPNTEIRKHFGARAEENDKFVVWARGVEDWIHTWNTEHETRRERSDHLMVDQAALLTPPMEEVALYRCASFKAALARSRVVTLEDWNSTWRARILAERVEAERLVEVERDENRVMPGTLMTVAQRQYAGWTRQWPFGVDLRALLEVAGRVLGSIEILEQTHEEDIVLRALHMIHEASTTRPGVMGEGGSLYLSHLRYVLVEMVMPFVEGRFGGSLDLVSRRFHCAGCSKSPPTFRTVEGVIEHIGTAHAISGHVLSHFRQPHGAEETFAWHSVPWPKNLPVLAVHRPSRMGWKMGTAPVWKDLAANTTGHEERFESLAFHRAVANASAAPADMVGNALYAARELARLPLEPEFKTQIVWQYALDNYITIADLVHRDDYEGPSSDRTTIPRVPPIDSLLQICDAMDANAFSDLFGRFLCGACTQALEPHDHHMKWATRKTTVRALISHFRQFHAANEANRPGHVEIGSGDFEPWTSDMVMRLAPGPELHDALVRAETKKEFNKGKLLRRIQRKRKRADDDVNALETRTVWEIYFGLFRVEAGDRVAASKPVYVGTTPAGGMKHYNFQTIEDVKRIRYEDVNTIRARIQLAARLRQEQQQEMQQIGNVLANQHMKKDDEDGDGDIDLMAIPPYDEEAQLAAAVKASLQDMKKKHHHGDVSVLDCKDKMDLDVDDDDDEDDDLKNAAAMSLSEAKKKRQEEEMKFMDVSDDEDGNDGDDDDDEVEEYVPASPSGFGQSNDRKDR